MPRAAIGIADGHVLPRWRRPEALLLLMAVVSPLAFDGFDIGVLHVAREIPGFLWLSAPGAVYTLAAALALCSLGMAVLVPRHPAAGIETVLLVRLLAQPGE